MKIYTQTKQKEIQDALKVEQSIISRALNFKNKSIAAMKIRAMVLTKYNGFLIK